MSVLNVKPQKKSLVNVGGHFSQKYDFALSISSLGNGLKDGAVFQGVVGGH